MKNMPRSLLALGLTSTLILGIATVQAQPQTPSKPRSGRPELSGEINYENTEEKKVDHYSINQDKAVAYFTSLVASATSIASSGDVSSVQVPEEGIIQHMTGVYLYCITKSGVCQYILDAILEIDAINSRASGKADCPAMSSFWTLWKRNDFENRFKYSVSTGHLQLVSEFNRSKRPRFLLCKDTLTQEVLTPEPNASFFKTRYADQSQLKKSLVQTAAVLKQIQNPANKIGNVFVATGSLSLAR